MLAHPQCPVSSTHRHPPGVLTLLTELQNQIPGYNMIGLRSWYTQTGSRDKSVPAADL